MQPPEQCYVITDISLVPAQCPDICSKGTLNKDSRITTIIFENKSKGHPKWTICKCQTSLRTTRIKVSDSGLGFLLYPKHYNWKQNAIFCIHVKIFKNEDIMGRHINAKVYFHFTLLHFVYNTFYKFSIATFLFPNVNERFELPDLMYMNAFISRKCFKVQKSSLV